MLWLLNNVYSFIGEQAEHNTHVTETLLASIKSVSDLTSKAEVNNVQMEDEEMVFQGSKHENSIVHFKDQFNENNFSIEITLDHLKLSEMQKSGLFVWVTDKKLPKGNFKGGPGNFHGMLAGIEFSHKKASLVFTYNNGLDFTHLQNYALHTDPIDSNKLENIDSITIKIIHTVNNFKIEVYSEGELIADTFKVNDPALLEMKESNFAMTSFYEDPTHSSAIYLSKIKINKREESEKYKNMDLHTEYNTNVIENSTKEVSQAVANISHFMAYFTAAFGGYTENPLSKLVMNVKERTKDMQDKLDSLSSLSQQNSDELYDENAESKLESLDETMRSIFDQVARMKTKIRSMGNKTATLHSKLGNFVIGFGILLTIATLIRVLFNQKVQEKKTLRDLE